MTGTGRKYAQVLLVWVLTLATLYTLQWYFTH